MPPAIRELEEETGLDGEIEAIAGVFSHVYRRSTFAEGADLHFIGIVYHVRIVGGELRDEVDGTTDTCALVRPATSSPASGSSSSPSSASGSRSPGSRIARVRSTIGIDVAAPPELVFRLARDVERWPRLLPHYVARPADLAARPTAALAAQIIARRPLVPVLGPRRCRSRGGR